MSAPSNKAPTAQRETISARLRRTSLRVCAIAPALVLSGCLNSLTSHTDPPKLSPVAGARQAIDPSLPPAGYDARRYGVKLRGKTNALGGHPDLKAGPPASTLGAAGSPSLFRGGSPSLHRVSTASLYSDKRARAVGDQVTVVVDISESASVNASSNRSRDSEAAVGAPTLFGLETVFDRLLPGKTVSLSKGATATSSKSNSSSGAVSRDETVSARIAATVVDVLPNGHLVIVGSQEVRVNFELRDVQVAGVVRPVDIARDNTITHDRIASARISIGGAGSTFKATGQTYGEKLVEQLQPF